jgi:hypothetical protein
VQHECDQRETSSAILARLDESSHKLAVLLGWPITDEASGALKDVAVAELIHFRPDLFGTTAQSRSKPCGVEDCVGIAVKEDEDVPRQQRPNVALHEPSDGLTEDAVQFVHSCLVS